MDGAPALAKPPAVSRGSAGQSTERLKLRPKAPRPQLVVVALDPGAASQAAQPGMLNKSINLPKHLAVLTADYKQSLKK